MSFEPSAPLVKRPEDLFPNPQPAKGCGVCASLYRQRLAAMNRKSPTYNPDAARRASAEIRNHPHGE